MNREEGRERRTEGDGNARRFPGAFDYYLEKKDTAGMPAAGVKTRAKAEETEASRAKEKARQEEQARREEEKRRKAHNTELGNQISKLRKEKERLQLEHYAKARALSNPRIYHDEETARQYGRRIKEIEKRMNGIEAEIKTIEARRL